MPCHRHSALWILERIRRPHVLFYEEWNHWTVFNCNLKFQIQLPTMKMSCSYNTCNILQLYPATPVHTKSTSLLISKAHWDVQGAPTEKQSLLSLWLNLNRCNIFCFYIFWSPGYPAITMPNCLYIILKDSSWAESRSVLKMELMQNMPSCCKQVSLKRLLRASNALSLNVLLVLNGIIQGY